MNTLILSIETTDPVSKALDSGLHPESSTTRSPCKLIKTQPMARFCMPRRASRVMVTLFDAGPTVGDNCRGFVMVGVPGWQLEFGDMPILAFRRLFSSHGENDISWFSLSIGDKDLPPVVALFSIMSISITRQITTPACSELRLQGYPLSLLDLSKLRSRCRFI